MLEIGKLLILLVRIFHLIEDIKVKNGIFVEIILVN